MFLSKTPTPAVLAALLLALALCGLPAAEAVLMDVAPPPSECFEGDAASWAPLTGASPHNEAILKATLIEFLDNHQMNSTWVPCDDEDLFATVAGCEQEINGEVAMKLWANLTCAYFYTDTVGLVADVYLQLPTSEQPVQPIQVVLDVLFEDVEPNPSSEATPDGLLTRRYSITSVDSLDGPITDGGGGGGGRWGEGREAAILPPLELPALPGWAADPTSHWVPLALQGHEENKKKVQVLNDFGVRLDFAMYGDSIVWLANRYRRLGYMKSWPFLFGEDSGLQSGLFGVSGNGVQDLAWRLIAGGEKPAHDPKVVAILIGINNLSDNVTPAAMLDWLVGWMLAAMPNSKIVVLALLPNRTNAVGPANARYRALAQKHGVAFSSCSQEVTLYNFDNWQDGTHPSPRGLDILFQCLQPLVQDLINS